ncbi:hypothetical protein L249_3222, partial [Ophiocordyceps polyrhachis-furcata BCC 54312]
YVGRDGWSSGAVVGMLWRRAVPLQPLNALLTVSSPPPPAPLLAP